VAVNHQQSEAASRIQLLDALGSATAVHRPVDRGSGRQDHRGHHHDRDRSDAGVRRPERGFRRLIQIVFGLSIAFAACSFFLSIFLLGGGALV
jgi:hypothetical protein